MAYAQAVPFMASGVRTVPLVELRRPLPSRISIITPFVEQLMRFIARFRNRDGSELDIEMALPQALANAIVLGNQLDPGKSVCIVCRCTTDGEVSITVQNEGSGFDAESVADPSTPENRLRTQGCGIYRMKTLMDEVRFEQPRAVVYPAQGSNASQGRKENSMIRRLLVPLHRSIRRWESAPGDASAIDNITRGIVESHDQRDRCEVTVYVAQLRSL